MYVNVYTFRCVGLLTYAGCICGAMHLGGVVASSDLPRVRIQARVPLLEKTSCTLSYNPLPLVTKQYCVVIAIVGVKQARNATHWWSCACCFRLVSGRLAFMTRACSWPLPLCIIQQFVTNYTICHSKCRVIRHLYSVLLWDESIAACDSKGITRFCLPPTHEPYLPLFPIRRASPPLSWYSLRLPTKGWPCWVDLGGWLYTEIDFPAPGVKARTRLSISVGLLMGLT